MLGKIFFVATATVALMVSLVAAAWYFTAPDEPERPPLSQTYPGITAVDLGDMTWTQGILVQQLRGDRGLITVSSGAGPAGDRPSYLAIREIDLRGKAPAREVVRVNLPCSAHSCPFAEGIAPVNWRGKAALLVGYLDGTLQLRDRDSLELLPVPVTTWSGPVWGLCSLGGRDVGLSDGSPTVHTTTLLDHRDRAQLTATGEVATLVPSTRANALSCSPEAGDWVNDWPSSRLINLSYPHRVISLTGMTAVARHSGTGGDCAAPADRVANGSAALTGGRLLVTGKCWPKGYIIAVD